MNLDVIESKDRIEKILLSITKNCETNIKRTHIKADETSEFKSNKPRETFSFKPPKPIEGSWMLGLTSLEVYNSIFTITENNKFELFTDTFDEFSFAELKHSVAEVLGLSNISSEDLQNEKKDHII